MTRISHDRSLILASTRIREGWPSCASCGMASAPFIFRCRRRRCSRKSPRPLAAVTLRQPFASDAVRAASSGLWARLGCLLARSFARQAGPDQLQALQEGLIAVLDERSRRLLAEEEARYVQQSELLQLLIRQHEILEQGQAIDLRHLSQYLVPLLRSVNITTCTPTPITPTGN